MDSIGNIGKFTKKTVPKIEKNKHLHSPSHLLADELSIKLNDKKHFGFYLKMATVYDHSFLRGLAGQIMENNNAQTPGRLFAYLIKKHNLEQKPKESSV